MKAQITEASKDGRQATLVLSGASLPLANGVVRATLADVETVAFGGAADSGLMVIRNTGALHDGMLLDRTGLVPIHFDGGEIDGFRREALVFELNVSCPASATGLLDVTSRDFRVADADGKDLGPKFAQRLFPVDPVTGDAPIITQLRRGEELHLKGHATKASGRKHAGFCPVSRAALTYEGDEEEPTAFRITLRSECGLSPTELLHRALASLKGRVAAAAAAVAEGEPPITTVDFESGARLAEVRFAKGQDSTLGEMLQAHLLRVAPDFAGYNVPHNLDELLVMRFDAMGKKPADVFARAAKAAIDEIEALQKALK